MKRISTRVIESVNLEVSRICPSTESPGGEARILSDIHVTQCNAKRDC
jgi:hypothetical protein